MVTLRLSALSLLAAATVFATSETRTKDASLSGFVSVQPDSGSAEGSLVSLVEVGGRVHLQGTVGARGAFEFRSVSSGLYELSAEKAGYLGLPYGAQVPFDVTVPIRVNPGDNLNGLRLVMLRVGSITGSVRDSAGAPMTSARVILERWIFTNGRRRLAQTGDAITTDSSGRYRFHDLVPSSYIVSVEVNGRGLNRLRRTFYPNRPTPDHATTVAVAPGEERTAIDISVLPRPVTTVNGQIHGLNTIEPQIVAMLVEHQDSAGRWTAVPVERNGERFRIPDLPSGLYNVEARALAAGAKSTTPPGRWSHWAQATVSVSETMSNSDVDLVLRRAGHISGSVVIRGLDGVSKSKGISVELLASQKSTGIDNHSTTTDADGVFVFEGVASGSFWIRVRESPGIYVEEIRTSRDVGLADHPIEFNAEGSVEDVVVTLSREQSRLSGHLRDRSGNPVAARAVLVFPKDEALWISGGRRIRVTRTDYAGEYRFEAIPSGAYLLAVVETASDGEWLNEDFLQSVATGAVPVAINRGRDTVQDLRMVR